MGRLPPVLLVGLALIALGVAGMAAVARLGGYWGTAFALAFFALPPRLCLCWIAPILWFAGRRAHGIWACPLTERGASHCALEICLVMIFMVL